MNTKDRGMDGGVKSLSANGYLDAFDRDSDILGDRSNWIRLDRNERPSPFPEKAFREIMARITPVDFTAYPDPGPLYRGLSRTLGYPEDWFCVGAGSDGVIRRVFQAYLRPGDRIVTMDPSYGMYRIYAQMYQADLVGVPYGPSLRADVDAFISQIVPGTRLVIVANPDQPTGSVMSREDLGFIAKRAAEVGALALIDEAYHPFCPETALSLLDAHSNLIVSRTFSKAGGLAGLRMGYGIGRPDLLTPVHKVRAAGEVGILGIVAASYLMDHPDIVDDFRRDVEEGRAVLLHAATELGFDYPPCPANFQLLGVSSPAEAKRIQHAFQDRGYLIKAGFDGVLARYIRVTLDGPAIIGPFVAALREICASSSPSR